MRVPAALPLLATLAACTGVGELDGGQTGEEMPAPCLMERTPIGWDEAPVSVGLSPAELVEAWPADGWTSDVSWAGGAESALALTVVAAPETAVLVVQEPSTPDGDPSDCQDLLEINGTVTWTSGDISEALSGTLRSEGDLAHLNAALPDGVRALTQAGEAPAGDSAPTVDVAVTLGPDTTWGTLTAFGTASLPDDWTVLATWGASSD